MTIETYEQFKDLVKKTKEDIDNSLLNTDSEALYETVSQDWISQLLEENNLDPSNEIRNSLGTLYSITKYFSLVESENLNEFKLQNLLNAEFDSDKIFWTFSGNFSNQIIFYSKERLAGQSLAVKYSLDDDQNFYFSLFNGVNGWTVSLKMLKAILEGKENVSFTDEDCLSTLEVKDVIVKIFKKE